jgi:hypothetical protein
MCSDIPLLPDGTPETSTCDIEKDQMISGTWGLILISNNGDDPESPPFANQRTFSLDVGAQSTQTVCLCNPGEFDKPAKANGWVDDTDNGFQYDKYTHHYGIFDINNCQYDHSQQLHDHHRTCSKSPTSTTICKEIYKKN